MEDGGRMTRWREATDATNPDRPVGKRRSCQMTGFQSDRARARARTITLLAVDAIAWVLVSVVYGVGESSPEVVKLGPGGVEAERVGHRPLRISLLVPVYFEAMLRMYTSFVLPGSTLLMTAHLRASDVLLLGFSSQEQSSFLSIGLIPIQCPRFMVNLREVLRRYAQLGLPMHSIE